MGWAALAIQEREKMIRLAERKDLQALQGLLLEIAELHHDLRPDLFMPASSKFGQEDLEAMLGNPQKPIYVYEANGQVLGHLFLEWKQPNNGVRYPHKSLYIEDLCVAQAARHQGVGQALMAFAEDLARQQGAFNLTLNVWEANQSARAFYERADFKPQQTQMEKIL